MITLKLSKLLLVSVASKNTTAISPKSTFNTVVVPPLSVLTVVPSIHFTVKSYIKSLPDPNDQRAPENRMYAAVCTKGFVPPSLPLRKICPSNWKASLSDTPGVAVNVEVLFAATILGPS